MTQIFDDWSERYDQWFETPIGSLVKAYESEIILKMLLPAAGEKILDAGCGTGVFTESILNANARVVGLELSLPMLLKAKRRWSEGWFQAMHGNMLNLPFADNSFEKVISITAIEFIQDARRALDELFRVCKSGGWIVVATLNRLSPWAIRRTEEARKGHSLFRYACFRSPEELDALAPVKGTLKTAIHFQKHDDPAAAMRIEEQGRSQGLMSGAFVIARWEKPIWMRIL